jgi:hypothetical protein
VTKVEKQEKILEETEETSQKVNEEDIKPESSQAEGKLLKCFILIQTSFFFSWDFNQEMSFNNSLKFQPF